MGGESSKSRDPRSEGDGAAYDEGEDNIGPCMISIATAEKIGSLHSCRLWKITSLENVFDSSQILRRVAASNCPLDLSIILCAQIPF